VRLSVVLLTFFRLTFSPSADRTFQTNVPDYDSPPHANLHALVKTLNPPIMVENSPDPYGPIPSPDEEINKWYPDSDLYQVVDLMKRCLECVAANLSGCHR
jgi:hypothetical protein